jgi:hypothetical protein
MKKTTLCVTAALLVLGMAVLAHAATEVKMRGDALIYGTFYSHRNFTGWNAATWATAAPTWKAAGTKTEEPFEIWERFRLRSDFVANEALKFRLEIKVEDTWGHGTFTAANPSAALNIYGAYLQFKWPGCDVETTAGLQAVALPHAKLFYSSPVFGDRMAALIVTAPLVEKTLELMAGYGRLIDTNRTYDTTTTQVADELDAYFLALPITVTGFKATPWGAMAVAGRNADYFTNKSSQYGASFYADNLTSAGTYLSPALWKNAQNAVWWAGGAFEVSALDPLKFYADVIYGAGAMADRKKSRRQGWFIDFGVEYTGWDVLTPQAYAWWSSGEDKATLNGSERMPMIRPNWGPGHSFLFDDNQELVKNSNMGMSPVGSWGLGVTLDNMSFLEKLSHRLTFLYVHGTNSPRAIRALNTSMGSNPYFQMGRDLTEKEYVLGVNFDHKYMLYENLAAIIEAGWAHGEFQKSVWGRRLVNQANSGDTWKISFGLSYKF